MARRVGTGGGESHGPVGNDASGPGSESTRPAEQSATSESIPPAAPPPTPMPGEQIGQVHLTPRELAKRMRGRVHLRTLQNWRSQRRGPRWIRVGKTVLYPIAEVEAWEKMRLEQGLGSQPGKRRKDLPEAREPAPA